MKAQLITLIALLVTQLNFAQSSAEVVIQPSSTRSTFYIKSISEGDTKEVFIVGDKMKVIFYNEADELVQLKGILTKIESGGIIIGDDRILIKDIHSVSYFKIGKIIGGAVGSLAGAGLILSGSAIINNADSTLVSIGERVGGGALMVIGGLAIAGSTFMAVFPKKRDVKKYTFHTYMA